MIDSDGILSYFVRHGQTALNASNSFRGNKDVPLDATGHRQADKLADLFEPIDVCLIVCSDKQRAVSTAETIGRGKKVPIHHSENLRALDVGDFSGLPRNPENVAALQHYIDNPDITIPGGESLNDFKARVRPCFHDILDIAETSGTPVLAVAHSSIIHELGALLYGDHHRVLVEPGGVVALHGTGDGIGAQPIYRPARSQADAGRSDTVS